MNAIFNAIAGKRGNLHTHTVYCDGADTPRQLIEEAIGKGFHFLGFSGHAYTAFDIGYCMSRENTLRYREEIAALKREYAGRIAIYCGVEQDYFSEEPVTGYDYVIGAVHYVYKEGQYIPVDESAEILRASVAQYWGGDYYALAEDYYSLLAKVTEKTQADMVAHFDLLRKYNQGNALFDAGHPRYLQAAWRAADSLIARGLMLEINTGAMARDLGTEPYPARQLREYIRAHGGRFILASDCHHRWFLDYGFDQYRPETLTPAP